MLPHLLRHLGLEVAAAKKRAEFGDDRVHGLTRSAAPPSDQPSLPGALAPNKRRAKLPPPPPRWRRGSQDGARARRKAALAGHAPRPTRRPDRFPVLPRAGAG